MRVKPGSSSSALALLGAAFLAATLAARGAEAKPVAPEKAATEPSARRTAARVLERNLSTQWLPDVDLRQQLLLEAITDQPLPPRERRESGHIEEIRR